MKIGSLVFYHNPRGSLFSKLSGWFRGNSLQIHVQADDLQALIREVNKMFWVRDLHWGWLVFGGLLRLALLAGLVVLVVFAILALFRTQTPRRANTGQMPGPAPANTALEILKERYARGEITKEQYDSMRQDLLT